MTYTVCKIYLQVYSIFYVATIHLEIGFVIYSAVLISTTVMMYKGVTMLKKSIFKKILQ